MPPLWLKLGFISLGGPSGRIAILHTALVDRRKWIDQQRFRHALNDCMLLPGPEGTQLTTDCGRLRRAIHTAGRRPALPG